MLKVISILCSIIGIIVALFGLIAGLSCIGRDGFAGIGIIFIPPSVIALTIILTDFLVTIEYIKKGFIYSCISTIIKIGVIIYLFPSIKYDFTHEMHNFKFFMIIICSILIVTIPSILNVFSFVISKKESSMSTQS